MRVPTLNQFFTRLFPRRARLMLTGADGFYDRGGSADQRDRFTYDREETLRQALEAWRANPLARRIVELTSQYVVGGGISVESSHPATHRFLDEWWRHPLNQMPMRCFELCDELTRSGELFVVVSTDAAGMSYLRAIPASEISEVHTSENDIDHETGYLQKPSGLELAGRAWPAYDPRDDGPDENGNFRPVVLHFAINRPAGAVRGESDLAPLLRWLARYAAWLEDRARLNRYRQTFLFVVKARFSSEAERQARQAALNAQPPSPGSILVTDEGEEWSVLQPELASAEAGEDGLALKKMIAAGSGIPLHFLAEPEGSTRTTAESAGGPTFRRFEHRQVYFLWLVRELAQAAVRRRAMVDRRVDAQAALQVRGADISGRDNTSLSVAASTIAAALKDLRDRGLIDDAELLRMVYKFAGEVVDVQSLLNDGRASGAPTTAPHTGMSPRPDLRGLKIDPLTGELKDPE
jgi:hypothetical protein